MTPAVPDVSILVVSKDDAADLPVSLAGALAQTGVVCETLLVDNASTDASREVAARVGVRLLALPENVGFAAGMNAQDIVFSGVGKTRAEIQYALDANVGQFNIELEEEGTVLAGLADGAGKTAPAVLRVNPDVDAEWERAGLGQWSRSDWRRAYPAWIVRGGLTCGLCGAHVMFALTPELPQ
jgi:GT2 family glycosyltransferase